MLGFTPPSPCHRPWMNVPRMASGINGIKTVGEIFLGCKVLVVYTNGDRQMLNLGPVTGKLHDRKIKVFIEKQAVRIFHNKDRKRKNPGHSPCAPGVTKYDVADRQTQVSKKLKVESFDPVTPGRSSSTKIKCSLVKDEIEQKPKISISSEPIKHKLSVIQDSTETVDVNGYKVKASAAPILEAIFAKYGNIAANSLFKSKPVIASLLEIICDIVQRLQNYFVDDILLDLEAIGNEVSDVEAARIEVSWLRKHLAKFHEVSVFHNKNLLLKKSKVNVDLLVEAANEKLRQRRGELVLAQEQVKEAEKCMVALNIVRRKIDEDINVSENEEYFWRRRLGGLLEGGTSYKLY
ncbi:hypothetical protein ACJIZ3_010216 [Penstemon smallii]|uniref:Phospholipase-like protein n=1 Tax=Penstemon smallii TaxID=265156 RepID=A0ABD3TG90_9LAMI